MVHEVYLNILSWIQSGKDRRGLLAGSEGLQLQVFKSSLDIRDPDGDLGFVVLGPSVGGLVRSRGGPRTISERA